MARHKNHLGYEGPASTKQHAAKHDAQMAAIDRHHASRNAEHGHHVSEGGRSSVAGAPSRERRSDTGSGMGTSGAKDAGNKGHAGGAFGGTKSGMPGLKRAASGSLDSGAGRRTV